MDEFKIILAPEAVKDIDSLDDHISRHVLNALKVLEENPFPRGKLIKKLKGTQRNFYRLRVDKYRLFYMIEGKKVILLRVISKKDADRFIQKL